MEAIPADETPNQRQARLRRERRAAKIQTEGNSRLEAITTLSGRKFQPAESPAPTAPGAANPALYKASVSDAHQDSPDPEEIDISEHHYVPRGTPRGVSSSTMQQWQGPPQGFGGVGMGNMQQQMPPDMANDPMMRMMQQMMGGAGGAGGPGGSGGDPMQGMPPMFQDMMNAMGGEDGPTGLQAQTASSSTYIWRIIHAIFSFSLAIYVTLGTSFNGSKSSRERSFIGGVDDEHFKRNLFLYFATAEVALQSSRYLIEKGQLSQSGLMGTLSRLLPEPYGGYIRTVGRYGVIYNTVVADAMVVVFVLGLVAWWKGQVEH